MTFLCPVVLVAQEKEKHRALQRATKQKHAIEMSECYFSPNLAVKSLEIASKADLQPLTKRAAALVIAQRQYREQQVDIVVVIVLVTTIDRSL